VITTDQVGQMQAKVARLWELVTRVAATRQIDTSGMTWQWGSGGAFTQQVRDAAAKLDANRALVFSGLLAFSTWWTQAGDLESTMSYYLKETAAAQTSEWLKDSFVATVQDVHEGATEIADAAKSGTTWGVLAAVVALLVVWRVS
jgi:hypothetical protein